MLRLVYNNVPLKQLHKLPCTHIENFRTVLGPLQTLVCLKQDPGPPGYLRGFLSQGFQPGGQRARQPCGGKHDKKRDGIAAVIGVQGKARLGKEKIKDQNAGHRGKKAADRAPCGNGNQHYA